MAQQTINVGAAPNDGTGTPLRTAFQYTNSNFSELYTATGPSGNNITVPGTATISGDLTVDTNTLKVDSANDNVGIGTTTPASYAFNDPVKLAIANTGTAGAGNTFTIASGSTGFGQIAFANGTSGTSRYNGYIKYSHSTNAMEFYTTAGALQATLNSTGLGVGGAPVNPLTVFAAASAKAPALLLSTAGSPTYGWDFSVDGAVNGNLFLRSLVGGVKTDVLEFDRATGNVGIGVTPAGTGGCLQLKSGITFPATQVASSDANTLDDYEEGTFTPVVRGSTTSGTGTYTTQFGRYTKVGRLVTVSVTLVWTAHTGTGNLQFAGLPFTSASTASAYDGIAIAYQSNISSAANTVLYGLIEFGSTVVTMTGTPVGGGAYGLVAMDTAGEIAFTATYTV